MVYGTYNYSFHGVFINQFITRGHHVVFNGRLIRMVAGISTHGTPRSSEIYRHHLLLVNPDKPITSHQSTFRKTWLFFNIYNIYIYLYNIISHLAHQTFSTTFNFWPTSNPKPSPIASPWNSPAPCGSPTRRPLGIWRLVHTSHVLHSDSPRYSHHLHRSVVPSFAMNKTG